MTRRSTWRGQRAGRLVVALALLVVGGVARATPAGDVILADLLVNSFTALAQGTEALAKAEETARRVREVADLGRRVANTADAVRSASWSGVGDRVGTGLLAAYPELDRTYRTAREAGRGDDLLDHSLTFCVADRIGGAPVVDPRSGALITRQEWCARFRQSGDWRLLAGAPGAADETVEVKLEQARKERADLLWEDRKFQFLACQLGHTVACAAAVCAGPGSFPLRAVPVEARCALPARPGEREERADPPPCPNPYVGSLSSDPEARNAQITAACEAASRRAQFADMELRAGGQVAEGRARRLQVLEAQIAELMLVVERTRRAQAETQGLRDLDTAVKKMQESSFRPGAARPGDAPCGGDTCL